MYGIFMESWVIFKNYGGSGLWLFLYAAAFIYLLITEKEKRNRVLILYVPVLILLLFFFPVFRMVYVAALDESATYYRILWLLPMGVTVAYAACKASYRFRIVGLVVMTGLIVLLGSYVYTGTFMHKAENLYHVPQNVIDICDRVAPAEGEYPVYITVPSELVYHVRQYNTDVCLAYGRDSVEPAWGYYNAINEAMNNCEVVDMEKLLEATRGNSPKISQYIIFRKDRKLDKKPEDCGLVLIDTIDEYDIYEDTIGKALLEEIYKQIPKE